MDHRRWFQRRHVGSELVELRPLVSERMLGDVYCVRVRARELLRELLGGREERLLPCRDPVQHVLEFGVAARGALVGLEDASLGDVAVACAYALRKGLVSLRAPRVKDAACDLRREMASNERSPASTSNLRSVRARSIDREGGGGIIIMIIMIIKKDRGDAVRNARSADLRFSSASALWSSQTR